jgi:serine/threonine protein kinase
MEINMFVTVCFAEMDNEYEALEHRLIDPTAEPISLPYEFLEMITKDFTVLIASGGFGTVCKVIILFWIILHKLNIKYLTRWTKTLKSVLMRYTVYFTQGYLPNVKKEVAVKRIQITEQFSDEKFERELTCLKRVKHKNIVRFLGYCSDATLSLEKHNFNGNEVPAHCLHRVLCFEYVPDKNLEDYLRGNTSKLIYV